MNSNNPPLPTSTKPNLTFNWYVLGPPDFEEDACNLAGQFLSLSTPFHKGLL